jgi:hypothetical protein
MRCAAAVRRFTRLAAQAAADPDGLSEPGVQRRRKLAAAKLIDARRALGGRHEGPRDHAVAVLDGEHSSVEAALAELDSALMGVLGSRRAIASAYARRQRLSKSSDVR